ncbi:MAG: glycosyltransferase [Bacteroidales bacterium]|nr:glycosyltransferase [Bacteroidales bacterium]
MKTAILSCFHPYRGGIAQFNNSLFSELSNKVDTIPVNFKKQYPRLLFPGTSQYVDPQDRETVSIDAPALLDTVNPFSWRSTAAFIRKQKPDLLLMRYWMPFFAPSLGWIAGHMDASCKRIAILDNVIPHERRIGDDRLTRYFLKRCDGFITLCDAVRDDLLSICPDARYIVSPHPIYSNFGENIERREAAASIGINPDKKTLLFFGLIREYKGLDILIEAFASLPEDYQLVIAGECYGDFTRYRKLINANPRKEDIHLFPRFIADSEVAPFFCAADVCVLPYRSATQSGISSICYQFGLPMVTTSVGGLVETIGATGTGILAEETTPEAILDKIKLFFSDPQIGANCREAIAREKKRLSWETFCDNLINFHNTL